MSEYNRWNRNLYLYHKIRGGVYLGGWDVMWDAQLQLDWDGVPILIRSLDLHREAGLYGAVKTQVQVILTLDLDRPYELTVSSGELANRGLNLLHREDYGCPELARERRIRTNEAAFTAQALKDADWRRCLLERPGFALSVENALAGDRQHTILVTADQYSLGGPGEVVYDRDPAELFRQLQAGERVLSGFDHELDKMLELAKLTHRALRTWRM